MTKTYKQSAAIPYRYENGELQILLITSIKRKKWIIPKGIIEPQFSAARSAQEEACEEAGVTGTMNLKAAGTYSYQKWGGICHVQVFPMQVKKVLDHWAEQNERNRRWFGAKEALQKVANPELREIIARFIDELTSCQT